MDVTYRIQPGLRAAGRRRQWHPTPVLLPGKSHGWRSLVGCSPWDREGSDMIAWLHFHFSLWCIGEGNGNPLQYSWLENPRDRGAWWAAIYGVSQSQTWLKWLSISSRELLVSFLRHFQVSLGVCGVPRCQVLISIIGRYFYQYLRMLLVRGQGRRPGGATPRLRSGAVAESSRLQQCRSSREELPYTRGQGRPLEGATPCPRSGVAAKRSNPTPKERWLHRRRKA